MATTSNMGLTLPDVSVTPGPTWASQINSDLTLIDQHNHIPNANGGVPITSAAIQIDADIEFNAILSGGAAAKGLSFLGLLAPVGTANVPTRIYSDSVGDLYYDNSAGVPVRLTNGANVAGVQGSITNLTSPASADYNLGTGTFKWESAANTGASMDSGPVTVRDGNAGANGITITPPSGLAAAYTLTLPSSAPSGQRLMTANAGVSSFASVDGTLTLTSSLLKVASNGITQTQLASNSVVTSKILDNAVTASKIPDNNLPYIKLVPKSVFSTAGVSATTNSTSPTTLMSASATLSANRPVRVELVPSGTGYSQIVAQGQTGENLYLDLEVQSPLGTSAFAICRLQTQGYREASPPSAFTFILTSGPGGVYTFSLVWYVSNSVLSGIIDSSRLVVYEL